MLLMYWASRRRGRVSLSPRTTSFVCFPAKPRADEYRKQRPILRAAGVAVFHHHPLTPTFFITRPLSDTIRELYRLADDMVDGFCNFHRFRR